MRTASIIEIQVPTERGARLADAAIIAQMDLLILDRFPDSLDEDVVAPRALAVHADRDLVGDQHAGEIGAGELASLIGIENLRPAVFGQSLLQGLDAESGPIVIDSRQARTRWLNQSTTAVR